MIIKLTADIMRQGETMFAGSVGRVDWTVPDAYPTLFYGEESCWLVPMHTAVVLEENSGEYREAVCSVCGGIGSGELYWVNPASGVEEIDYNAKECWMCLGCGVKPPYFLDYPQD